MPGSSYANSESDRLNIYGISNWTPGEWNSFSQVVTIPDDWDETLTLRVFSYKGDAQGG